MSQGNKAVFFSAELVKVPLVLGEAATHLIGDRHHVPQKAIRVAASFFNATAATASMVNQTALGASDKTSFDTMKTTLAIVEAGIAWLKTVLAIAEFTINEQKNQIDPVAEAFRNAHFLLTIIHAVILFVRHILGAGQQIGAENTQVQAKSLGM
ncbi:MAG: hypothetical protein HKM04_01175 [Legionellales bacterium]|nr:hypothetical protein [Legionellales bacterium]